MPAPGGSHKDSNTESRGYGGAASGGGGSGFGGGFSGGVGTGASASGGFGGHSSGGYGGASAGASGGLGGHSSGGYGGVGAGSSGGLGMGSGSGYGGVGAGARGGFGGGNYGGGGSGYGGVGAGAGGSFGSLNGGYSGPGGAWGKSSIEGLHGLNAMDRQLVGIASKIQRDFGVPKKESYIAASEFARSIYGELGAKWGTKPNAAAIGRIAANRLGLAKNKGQYHGIGALLGPNGVMAGFDANGYAPRTRAAGIGPEGNEAFQAADPGTTAYQTGLDAMQGQLFGTGPSLPEGVVNATNYRGNYMGAPSWERGVSTTEFGPHTFSNPDIGRTPAAVAASNRQIASLSSRPGISPLSGPSGTVTAGFGIAPGAAASASLNPSVNPSASSGVGPVASASTAATPTYSDVPQGSWGDYLGNILGSGFQKAKTYGSDYIERAKSPENISAFARRNPFGALGLADAFGSLSPGKFGPVGDGNRQMASNGGWFDGPSKTKSETKSDSDSKDKKKKSVGKKTAQHPPKWVFPTMLTRPYTRIS